MKPDRKAVEAEALRLLTTRMGLYATDAQIRAGARKMADMAIAQARSGPQRDDL